MMMDAEQSKIPDKLWFGELRKHTQLTCDQTIPVTDINSRGYKYSEKRTLVLHRCLSGYVMIELDHEMYPVNGYKDVSGITIMKLRYLDRSKFREVAFRKTVKSSRGVLKREVVMLHTNDASLLAPLPENLPVEVYTNISVQTVITALRAIYKNHEEDQEAKKKPPPYEEIRQLIPNMSRSDYKKIYGVNP